MKTYNLILAIILPFFVMGQKFTPGVFSYNGNTLKYQLYVPLDKQKTSPLVLFLHGAGERGNDNIKQLNYIKDVISTDWFKKYNSYVIVPQCPANYRWVETDWSLPEHKMPKTPSVPMQLTIQLLDSLITQYPIDTNRIYIVGLSMGGFGVWDALARYNGKFAAAVAICGGADTATAQSIASVPVWVFHGSKDPVVKVSRSRQMVKALKEHGGKPLYTEYPNVGHGAWFSALPNPKTWQWLFSQKKTK